jgi:hypothetical protein
MILIKTISIIDRCKVHFFRRPVCGGRKFRGSRVVGAKGSDAVYVSQPEAVAQLIRKAAKSVASK